MHKTSRRSAKHKKLISRLLSCCAILIGIPPAFRAEPATALEISAPVCPAPPTIDGRLSDACWQTAATTICFRIVGETNTTTEHTAYVACDTRWLYVGFRVAQGETERSEAVAVLHDQDVQREDNVQVSFDPGTGGNLYYQFLLSKTNVRADFRMTRTRGRDREGWSIPWRSATQLNRDNWTAELAIPFCLVMTPGATAANARVNFWITTLTPVRDDHGVAVGGVKRTDMSWAPVGHDFHEPNRFGRLRGIEALAFQPAFLPWIQKAAPGNYTGLDQNYGYPIQGIIANYGSVAGQVQVAAHDQPVAGTGRTATLDCAVTGRSSAQAFSTAVPVDKPGTRQITLTLRDPATGEVLQTLPIADLSALNVMETYLDRSYYTTEPAATLVCQFGISQAILSDMRLQAVDAANRVLAESHQLAPAFHLSIPLTNIAPGIHAIRAVLLSEDGRLLAEQPLELVKRPPRPGCEVKIDRINRILLKDGEPFFPFGVVMGGIEPDEDAYFADAAAAGFNTILQWNCIHNNKHAPGEAADYARTAARHGLNAIICVDEPYAQTVLTFTNPPGNVPAAMLAELNEKIAELVKRSGTFSRNIRGNLAFYPGLNRAQKSALYLEHFLWNLPTYEAVITGAAPQTSVLGYYYFDEPLLELIDQAAPARILRQRIQELDGYRPNFCNYSSGIPAGDDAVDWVDCLAMDPYITPGARHYRGAPDYVGRMTAMTGRRAAQFRAVTWIIPLAEYWSGSHKRAISPAEQRCQTYLALIRGAKGIIYYIYPNFYGPMWRMWRELASEIKTLAPAILAPDLPQTITQNGLEIDPEKAGPADLAAVLRRQPDGSCLLLAANSAWYPVEVVYEFPLLPSGGTARGLFDGQAYAVDGGKFADTLEPCGTRAYAITAPAAATGSLARLDIRLTSLTNQAVQEAQLCPVSGRPDMKNLLPNPSFEDAVLPGWPDYWRPYVFKFLAPERIGEPGAIWGQDFREHYHGRASLRMTVDGVRANGAQIKLDMPGETGTLSWYMKASRDGMTVTAGSKTGDAGRFTPTREWQRYSLPLKTKGQIFSFLARLIDGGGTVWLDAVQIEAGPAATEFEP